MKTVAFPLLGRSAELERLTDALDTTSAGTGALVVIEGEPGIGKSRLLEEVARRASGAGFALLAGAAQELESERPFGLIRDALAAAARGNRMVPAATEIASLLNEVAPERLDPALRAPDARFQVVDAFSDAVERIAGETPLLVVLDDLHWSDPSSLMAVTRLVRSVAAHPIALVVSSRLPPRPREVEQVLDSMLKRGALHLELAPLHDETVTALVVEAVGGSVGPRLRRLAARAAGNPLLVVELLRALMEEDAITFERGVADVVEDVLPPSVRGTVARRLRLLSPETVDVLRMGAVLGRSFSVDDLAVATGITEIELVRRVEEARGSGLLTTFEDELGFRHDLVRQAIYEDMALGVRRSLHARAGRKLAAAGRPAGLVAVHLSLGASPGDAEAVEWLERAARDAAPLDPVSAADLLRRALELTTDAAERVSLAPELVAALVWSGRLVDAEEEAMRALPDASPSTKVPLQLGLARALLLQSRWSEAAQQFSDLASDASVSPSERARMKADEALARAFGLENEAALRVAGEAEELAAASGADTALVLALQARSITTMFQGYTFDSIDLGARAIEVALGSDDEEAVRVHPELFQAFVLVNADRAEEGERLLLEGRERGRNLGTVWDIPLYRWYMAMKHFHTGDWNEAVEELEAGITVADEIETNWELLNLYGTLANITLHRGDFRRTETLLREIERRTHPSRAPVALIWYAWTRALLAEANGDPAGGYRIVAEQWDRIRERDVVVAARRLGPDLVRLALAAGDRASAEAVAQIADIGAERAAFPSSLATALHCRGLLERDPKLLLEAASAYSEGPRPLQQAVALEEAGALLHGSGDGEEAVSVLQEAARIYEGLGASYDLSRAEAQLRELGIRRARPRRSGRPQTGWESLTETERKVVGHVAEGLTNPEIARRMFVSPRTVSTHLKHIFKKLGVTSRVELATQATRRDSA